MAGCIDTWEAGWMQQRLCGSCVSWLDACKASWIMRYIDGWADGLLDMSDGWVLTEGLERMDGFGEGLPKSKSDAVSISSLHPFATDSKSFPSQGLYSSLGLKNDY